MTCNIFNSWMNNDVKTLTEHVEGELAKTCTNYYNMFNIRDIIKYLQSQVWWTLNYKSSKPFLCHLNQCRSLQNLKTFMGLLVSPIPLANKLPTFNWNTCVSRWDMNIWATVWNEFMLIWVFWIAPMKFDFVKIQEGHYCYIWVKQIARNLNSFPITTYLPLDNYLIENWNWKTKYRMRLPCSSRFSKWSR